MTDEAPAPRVDPRGSTADGASVAARLGATLLDLEVVEVIDVVPGTRRVRLAAPELGSFEPRPGQDLMFAVPADGGQTYRRRYTIRRFSAAAQTVDVEVVLHSDGPGARWARSVRPGDRIEAIGPRGKIFLSDDAGWHLFAGDESGVPVAFAMIEALPPAAVATAVLEVPSRDEEQPPPDADVRLRWLHRESAEPGRNGLLVEAIKTIDLPGPVESGHAYLTGELRVVSGMRQALADRGMASDQLSPKPYWRLGVANAPHGEPIKD